MRLPQLGPARLAPTGRRRTRPAGVPLLAGALLAALIAAPGAVSPSAHRAAPQAGPAGTTRVSYHGISLAVPASWPVIDLARQPTACVRLDRHAVYLGTSTAQPDCPAHLVGRSEALWLRPLTPGAAGPQHFSPHAQQVGALQAHVGQDGAVSHVADVAFDSAGVEVQGSYAGTPDAVNAILATAQPAPATGSGMAPQALSAPARPDVPQHPAAPSGRAAAATAAASTFTGMGFDTCAAPTTGTMSAWLSSPYRSAGIYIGGSMRACGDGNLSAGWVSQVKGMGWGLVPIYVGLQAPCVYQPPNPPLLATISPSQAASQGTAAADDAVGRAQYFGLGTGSPVYFDMEAYNTTVAGCSQTVLTFISAWDAELHRQGYLAGVYGSTGSMMVDLSNAQGSGTVTEPDDVWFAHWNGLQTTSDSAGYPAFSDSYWNPHHRLHQYSGDTSQTWGGVSIGIDANWDDGDVAGAAVPVDYGPNTYGPGGTNFVFTGSMDYWHPNPPAGVAHLAYYTGSNGATEYNGATWSPQLAAGTYAVQVSVPASHATANAPYTITDATGTHHQVLNQAARAGFVTLGTFAASPSTSITVHVGDNDPTSATSEIGVDAVRFIATGTFHPTDPARILDTRSGAAANARSTAVPANSGITVAVAGAGGSPVPPGASAVAVNMTVTNPAATGYLAVTPASAAGAPGTSNLNFTAGQTVPNLVVSPLAGGSMYVYNGSPGSVDVIADVEGYYTQDASGGTHHAIPPARVLDTRPGNTMTANPQDNTAVPGNSAITVAVAGAAGSGVPPGATAVTMNVTATDATATGFLSVAPVTSPGTSNLNITPGQTVPNLVVSKLAADGTVSIYNGSPGPVNVLADVAGYDTPDLSGAGYTPAGPARILDTRSGTSANPRATAVPGKSAITVAVAGLAGSPVPQGAGAVTVNVTVTAPTATGFLSVAPATSTGTSNLNFTPGQTVPNLVSSQLAPDGTVSIYNGSPGTVDVIADVAGFSP